MYRGDVSAGMEERTLGTTRYDVTEVGMGTWNIGSDWGDVFDEEAHEAVAPPSRESTRSTWRRRSTSGGDAISVFMT